MSRGFQLSFFRWAVNLPDSEPVRLLRLLADAIYRQLGGAIIEEHLAAYGDIFARWRSSDPDAPPLREAMRAMGARERALAKLERLREQAWLQARAEVFQQTGQRIPLPQSPEDADRQQRSEADEIMQQFAKQVRELGARVAKAKADQAGGAATSSPGASPQAPAPAAEAPGPGPAPAEIGDAALSHREIKIGIRRLVDAQVNRKVVDELRAKAEAGGLSRSEFANLVTNLLDRKEAA